MNVSSGMTHATQAVTTIRVPRRSPVTRGSRRLPGQGASQDGGDAGEQVRYADQVGQDEVAVEADEREQLLQHFQVGEGDDQEQDLIGGGHVEAGQGQHEDRVEVQAAEVGAQPPGAGEPVGVGDVGEERRPDQVDADADRRRAGRRRTGSRPRGRIRGTRRRPGTGRARRAGRPGCAGPAGRPRPARGRRTATSPRPATLTATATTTGQRNSGRSSVPAAFAARSGSSVPRARSANSGLAVGAAAGAPPAATTPRGSSLAVMR